MEKYSEITSYTHFSKNYMQNHQVYSLKIIYEILKYTKKELALLQLLTPHSKQNES